LALVEAGGDDEVCSPRPITWIAANRLLMSTATSAATSAAEHAAVSAWSHRTTALRDPVRALDCPVAERRERAERRVDVRWGAA